MYFLKDEVLASQIKEFCGVIKIDLLLFLICERYALEILYLGADVTKGDVAAEQHFVEASLADCASENVEHLVHIRQVDIYIVINCGHEARAVCMS